VIEATGVGPAADAALAAVDRGGSLMIFGVAPEDVRIDFSPYRVYAEEITILGSMAIFQSFAPALTMLAAGIIDVEQVVTHQFRIEQFDEALDTMRSRTGLKIQFSFD
jgi:NADPH2:quinone reductase